MMSHDSVFDKEHYDIPSLEDKVKGGPPNSNMVKAHVYLGVSDVHLVETKQIEKYRSIMRKKKTC